MVAKNTLTETPPYAVERTLTHLGSNLRTARLRRNLTIGDVAEKIGTGPRAVADAERGKHTTGAVVYIALLWAYDLLDQFDLIADPALDKEGLARIDSRLRARTRDSKALDNDF